MSAIIMTEAVSNSEVNDTTSPNNPENMPHSETKEVVLQDGTTTSGYFYVMTLCEVLQSLETIRDGIPRDAKQIFSNGFLNFIPTRVWPHAGKCLFNMVVNNHLPQLRVLSKHELPKKYYVADLANGIKPRRPLPGTQILYEGTEVSRDFYDRVDRHVTAVFRHSPWKRKAKRIRQMFRPGFWRQLTTQERRLAVKCLYDRGYFRK